MEYSPDGKLICVESDRNGREELYVIPSDGAGELKKITDVDSLKMSYSWSPDSKKIAFTTSDGKLFTVNADGSEQKEIASSKYGEIRFAWSPDGKMFAISKDDATRTSDIYLVPSTGGEEKKITFDPANETNPKFSADGKKVYFVRSDMNMMAAEGGGGFGGRNMESNIYVIYLEKQDKDPEEAAAGANAGRGGRGAGMGMGMGGARRHGRRRAGRGPQAQGAED